MSWLDKQVSLYINHSDNTGKPATFRDILFTHFGKNMNEIYCLRKLNEHDSTYKERVREIKTRLQAYTPGGLLKSKKKRELEIIERSGIMQLDFDYKDIMQYDIEELKQAVFALPFIAFTGLSCSGKGFYALALISEPERLEDYATHCFATLNEYGIKPDESKGKKPENLRYLSYDCNMLYRENPEPLIIQVKQPPQANKKTQLTNTADNCLKRKEATETAHRLLNNIKRLESGGRTKGIQKYAYTLGGLEDGDKDLLEAIKKIIKTGDNFSDKEEFLLKCADDCFTAGGLKPII